VKAKGVGSLWFVPRSVLRPSSLFGVKSGESEGVRGRRGEREKGWK